MQYHRDTKTPRFTKSLSLLIISEYIDGKEFTDFKKNCMIVDAVVRNFEIIGEASKNISIFCQLYFIN
jgi:uncharacterized protein with HEPN domain